MKYTYLLIGETFRIAYVQLFKVHSVLVDKPWFACTATLNSFTFQTVCKLAGFKPNIQVIKTPIDRLELKIIRRVMTVPEKKDF